MTTLDNVDVVLELAGVRGQTRIVPPDLVVLRARQTCRLLRELRDFRLVMAAACVDKVLASGGEYPSLRGAVIAAIKGGADEGALADIRRCAEEAAPWTR